jgi:hypothetical protein
LIAFKNMTLNILWCVFHILINCKRLWVLVNLVEKALYKTKHKITFLAGCEVPVGI